MVDILPNLGLAVDNSFGLDSLSLSLYDGPEQTKMGKRLIEGIVLALGAF